MLIIVIIAIIGDFSVGRKVFDVLEMIFFHTNNNSCLGEGGEGEESCVGSCYIL